MQDRLNEIKRLKQAHDEYIEIRDIVAKICLANPYGLRIKPLYGQSEPSPVSEPASDTTEAGFDFHLVEIR